MKDWIEMSAGQFNQIDPSNRVNRRSSIPISGRIISMSLTV
ncbi:hypothetical protein PO124_16670 [Bacillus licheniformis]|nr:hypothetical protein [Bacillus licheniformis]